jgi:hypothetical protein
VDEPLPSPAALGWLRSHRTYTVSVTMSRTVIIDADEWGGKAHRAMASELFAIASEIEALLPGDKAMTCEVSTAHGRIEIRCAGDEDAKAVVRAIAACPSADRTERSPLGRRTR